MKYHRISPEEAARLARRDKNRLIGLSVLTVLVVGAYLFTVTRDSSEVERPDEIAAPAGESTDLQLKIPEFTDTALLDEIEDATPEERELLATEPLEAVFGYSRLLTDSALVQMGIRELTDEVRAELSADPSEHRLEPFRGRGRVVNVFESERSQGSRKDWRGTLLSLDGNYTHFMVAMAPRREDGERRIEFGDYMKIDGIFHAMFAGPIDIEGEPDQVEGPLIVSARIDPSSIPMDEETARLAPALSEVEDDTIGSTFDDEEFETAYWQLMGRAQLLAGETDWENVPELDKLILDEIHEDGAPFRGKPFRIPVSINLDTFSRRVNDNPLRLDRTTVGWIGNNNWNRSVKTIKWHGPFVRQDMLREELDDAHRYVTARGYFFRNHVFTGGKGQPARSPVFILEDIEVYQVAEDRSVAWFTYGVLGLTVILTGVIMLLLRADRKKSRALYEDMVRRKRERRERSESTAAPTA